MDQGVGDRVRNTTDAELEAIAVFDETGDGVTDLNVFFGQFKIGDFRNGIVDRNDIIDLGYMQFHIPESPRKVGIEFKDNDAGVLDHPFFINIGNGKRDEAMAIGGRSATDLNIGTDVVQTGGRR